MLNGVCSRLTDRCARQKELFVRQVAARFTMLRITSGFTQAESVLHVFAKAQGVLCVCVCVCVCVYGVECMHSAWPPCMYIFNFTYI